MTGSKFIHHSTTTDVVTAIYLLITAIYAVVFVAGANTITTILMNRILILSVIVLLILANMKWDRPWLKFLHLFFPIFILPLIYGETASLNHLIFSENLDPVVYNWEQYVFGFQPSLEFSNRFPQRWFSEMLHFGYFSYYLMTISMALAFFIFARVSVHYVIHITVCSFLIYYLIFILFPVVGPQFYFTGADAAIADSGLFSKAVRLIQLYGEHPTGAFPSSHVGMVLIFLYLGWRYLRTLFWVMLPLFILILLATVYLKAHYAVDVFAGLLSAPLVFICSHHLYGLVNKLLINQKSHKPA